MGGGRATSATLGPLSTALGAPAALLALASGQVYLVDSALGQVLFLDPASGRVSLLAGGALGPSLDGQGPQAVFQQPRAIAQGPTQGGTTLSTSLTPRR